MTTITADRDLTRAYRAVGGVSVVLTAGAWFLLGGPTAIGVVLGAAMSGLSLVLLAKAVRSLMAGARSSWALLAAFKFAFLLILTYWVLESRVVPALGFALGIGALPLGIFLSSLFIPPSDPQAGLPTNQDPTRKD